MFSVFLYRGNIISSIYIYSVGPHQEAAPCCDSANSAIPQLEQYCLPKKKDAPTLAHVYNIPLYVPAKYYLRIFYEC